MAKNWWDSLPDADESLGGGGGNWWDSLPDADESLDQPGDWDFLSQYGQTSAQPAVEEPPSRELLDYGKSALSGVVRFPESIVGLVDLFNTPHRAVFEKVTGKDAKTVTEILADIGVDFAGARGILAESKSEGSKAEREAVNKAFADDGIFGGLKSLGSNPQVIAETVVESVPEMLSLAGLVRVAAVNVFSKAVAAATSAGATREAAIIAGRQAVEQAAPRLATLSAVLEGAQSAGNQAAEYAAEGRLKERQALASLAGGAGVAAVGFGLNRVAPRLGLEDVETAMATGGLRGGRGGIIDRARGAVSGAARGALREGPLEEGAQSYLEQIAQNFGDERPLFEGTGQAAVEGMLAGTVLGAGGGGFAGARPDRAEQLARQLDQDIDATNWAPESDTRVAVDMLSPDRGVAPQAPTSAAPPAVEPAPAPVAPMQPEAAVPPSVTTTWVDDDGIPHPVQVVQADVPVEGDPRPHSLVSYAGTEVLVPSDQLQSAPRREINFTPADSPTAQAGLQPIIVPEVTPNVSRTDAPVPVPAGSSGLGGTDAIGSLGVAGRNDVGGRRLVDTGAEPGAAGASAVVGGGTAAQPTPSVVEWTGRNGNGYATLEDATRGLTRRQQLAPGYDWRVEPAGDRFKLVGERIEQAPVQTETEAAVTAGPTEAGQAETLRDMGDLESAAARRATAQAALDRLANQGRIERISLGEPDPVLAQQVQDLGDTLTRAFGSDAKVVPFASDDASAPQGMQLGNLLLIDTVTPQNPVANTTLHEFKHSIEAIAAADTRAGRKNTPAQRFTEQIHSLFDDMSEEGKRSYLENFLRRDELRGITDPVEREARIQELLGSDELRSEMTADFMGNRANDREWLADLARTDPEGFRGFVQKWIDLLDSLVKSLRGIKNQSRMESARVDQYVKDLNRAKMVARDALVEFRKSTAKPAGAREGAAAGTTTGRPGARPRSSVKDAWLNRRVGQPRFSTRQPMDGRAFTGFFSNITAGLTGRPGDRAFTPTLNVDGISEFVREYERHRGNFDDHIGTSIPTFRELQTIVGDAIVKSFDNADMLDVGASEGALVKTISKLSDGNIRTVALDPNPSMAAHFNSGERVPGSKYAVEAFGTRAEEGLEAWVEDDVLVDRDGSTRPNPYAGQQIRFYKPDRKFDVVHEAMVFQFINADRAQQVSRIKELMKPGGIVILEEKFIPGPGLPKSQFDANEAQKDAFKEQYFTQEQIEAKARAVGVKDQEAYRKAQAEQESQVVGMADLMVAPAQLEKVLGDNFQHVVQFWDAGNFKGYMASDSRANLENLLGNMVDVNSEFSTTQTPRWVGDSAPLMSRRQGATSAETTRRSDRNEQAAGFQPPRGDIYRNIEVRPGTTAEQKRLGRSAVRDFFNWLQRAAVRAGESPRSVSLLGASMYRGFVEGAPQSLIGSTISSSADLAALAQVYRDPRFETLRAFFVDADGNVILEQAASTRNPASINFGGEFLPDLTDAFRNSGAEKFYLLHNHPSGSPAPSESDVRFTQRIADELGDAFASHVVIDHNSYAVIDRNGDYKVIDAPELVGIDFSTRPEAEHELLGTSVRSPKDIGMIGKRIAQADDPVLVVTKGGVYAEVGLITSVPMSFLELAKGPSSDRARFLAGLRRMIRVAGVGGRAFVVLPKSADSRQNYGWMHEAFAQDVINSDGVSVLNPANIRNKSVDDVTGVTMRGGRIATRTAQLREDSAAPSPTEEAGPRFSKKQPRVAWRPDRADFTRRLQEDGGATFNADGSIFEADTGYSVALLSENVTPPTDVYWAARAFANKHRELLRYPQAKLGVFKFPDSDTVALDLTMITENRDQAVAVGTENNQHSIWSFADGDIIETGGDGNGVFTRQQAEEVLTGEDGTNQRQNLVEQSPLRQAADRVIKDSIQRAAVESVLGGRVAEMSDTQLRDAVSRAAQDPAQRRVIAQTEAGRQLLDAATSTEPEQVPMFSQRQTDTPEFKRWFGDSKVVDENGEPLVVYHGGTVGNVFDAAYSGTGSGREGGFFFTPDIRQARDYAGSADVKAVYLSIQNPLYTDTQLDPDEVAQAKVDGYDGYWLIEDGLVEESEIVAFDPNQIKSATGNIGTFDPSNPDIRFSRHQPLGFYSELSRRVEGGPNTAMKDQWKGYINGLKQKGVKPDEIEWSGVLDWLDMQTGKVSRDDVLNFLDNNGVQLEEVTSEEVTSYSESMLMYGPSQTEFGEWDVYGIDGDVINTFPTQEDARRFARGGDFARKYDSYTVPGDSSNYREVLLTLPAPAEQVSPDFLKRVRREYLPNGLIGITLPSGLRHTARTDAEADAIIERAARNSKAMTRPGAYKSSHWDQPNVIAHVRTTDRVDADGNRVLFVEEVQSDWAQEGRKKGFTSDAAGYQVGDDVPGWGVIQAIRGEDGSREFDVGGLWVNESRLPAPASDRRARAIPRAPFVTSTDKWVSLAIKRILTMAAEGGYDKVAFVNGEQAAEMFDLSNQISEVNYNPDDEWLTAYDHNGGRVFDEWVAPEDLDNYVGKELADRIRGDVESNRAEQDRERGEWSAELDEDPDTGEEFYILIDSNGEPLYSNFGELERFDTEADAREWIDENVATELNEVNLSGLDLKVGGEGMRGFYDTIVPKVLRNIGKRVGAKVESINLDGTDQIGITITPEMREKITTEGLPMFSQRQQDMFSDDMIGPETEGNQNNLGRPIAHTKQALENFKRWFGDSELVDDRGRPQVFYHTTANDFSEFESGRVTQNSGTFGTWDTTRAAMFFTSSIEDSQAYGNKEGYPDHMGPWDRGANVMPVYLKANNVLDLTQGLSESDWNNIENHGLSPSYISRADWSMFDDEEGVETVAGLRAAGYDAVKFWDENPETGDNFEAVAVFDPNQIKSATGNRGTFDPDNPDITMSRRQTDTPEFKRWFGDSKVVDENGRPLVVYHGTTGDFDAFDASKHGEKDHGWYGFGHYLTADPDTASAYAVYDEMKDGSPTPGANVMPVYVSLQNPYIWPKDRKPAQTWEEAAQLTKELRDAGYDGVIVPNEYQAPEYANFHEVVAFRPEQIKSATGNRGTFDPSNPDITMSRRQNALGQAGPHIDWTVGDTGLLDDFIYLFQDKHVDLKRVQQAITEGGKQIEDQWDAYLKEGLYHGRAADQTLRFMRDEIRPLMVEIKARGESIESLEEYLHNAHAISRNAQIRKINPNMQDAGSGIPDKAAQTYLDNLPADRRNRLEALAKRVRDIIHKTQDVLVAGGLETQETIDTWRKVYPDYVPLEREDLDFGMGNALVPGSGQGYSVRGSSSRRATGSMRPVKNILANIALQRENAITRAEKNRVATALYGLAVQNPNTNFWLPVNPDMKFTNRGRASLASELTSMGLNPLDARGVIEEPKQQYIDPITGLVTQRVNPALRNSDNVIALRINGQDRYLFLNNRDPRAQRMAVALKNLDPSQMNLALRTSASITRWLASVNTQYNPIFGVVNFTRDIQAAALNLTTTELAGKQAQVMKAVPGALGAIYNDLRKDRGMKSRPNSEWNRLWREFSEIGAKTGYREQFRTSDERHNALFREMNNLHGSIPRRGFNAVFGWLSDYNEAGENAVRLAAYKVALDNGMSKERAAMLAKDLTVNFNRKGHVTQQMSALYAFFNASLQGTERTFRALRGPAGAKIIAGGLLLGVLQALGLAMAGFGEDEPPEFVRERNIIIPIPGGDPKDYITIPMPLGFHVIPNTSRLLTEGWLRGWADKGDTAMNLIGSVLDAFNPIGHAGWSWQTVFPTAVDPLIALLENRDWSGRPIYRESFSGRDVSPGTDRAMSTATWWSKEIAKYLNLASGGTEFTAGKFSPTPDQIDYLIGQATGGVGRETSKAAQLVESIRTGESLPPYKVPLAGRFYGTTSGPTGPSSAFYSNLERMARHRAEIDGRVEQRRSTGEYFNQHPEARLAKEALVAENEVRKARRRMREAIERGDRERVREIEERIANVMTRFNEKVDARNGERSERRRMIREAVSR